MNDLSPLVALAGGLLSLLSPCVLPIIPVYLASLAGPEIFQNGINSRRWTIFWHALSFILGFSVVFISLGTLAGLTGTVISAHSSAVRWISGGLMILFGLFMLAAPHVSWLNYEKRLSPSSSTATGYLRSILLGILFALAWTPCVGPILGSILTLALNSESVWKGTYLLGFYSLGLAIPFLIIGVAFQYLQPLLKQVKRFSSYIYLVSGILLIGVGILILLNKLSWFSWQYFS
jgi:cytochrome c-type biogenesis protein